MAFQQINNSRFRFKPHTDPVSSGSLQPVWNAGSIGSINIQTDAAVDGDILLYNDTTKLWETTQPASAGAVADGTALAPSFSFASDTNTGFYLVGPDNVGVTAGGTLQLDVSTTTVNTATTFSVAGTQILTTQQTATADTATVTTVGTNTGTAGAGLSLIGDTSTVDQSGAIMNDFVALQEDVTDIATQLNDLLAKLRTHGIIAT